MMKPKLHMSGLIRFGLNEFKAQWMFLTLLTLATIGLMAVPAMLLGVAVLAESVLLMILVSLLGMVAAGILYTVHFSGLIDVATGEKTSVGIAFGRWNKTLGLVGVSILYGLIVMGGFILFVIPGIIWAHKFCLAPVILMKENLGIMDSLSASAKRTNGYKIDIFGFYSVISGILQGVYLAIYLAFLSLVALTSSLAFATGGSSNGLGGALAGGVIGVILAIVGCIAVWALAMALRISWVKMYLVLSK